LIGHQSHQIYLRNPQNCSETVYH